MKPHPRKHPLVVALLHAYAHVFLEEIPAGLPTKRDIPDLIDLIPGAILPNKLAHRITQKIPWRFRGK